MSYQIIATKTFESAGIQLSFLMKLKDTFSETQEIMVEWTAPDYQCVEILWGLYRMERGEKRTFLVKGKPEFCREVLRNLGSKGRLLNLA